MNTNFRFISLVLIFFIGNSCTKSIKVKKNKAAGFVIYGTVTGFKDNTWIYLEDESDHNSIATDSALIYNEKFYFKGMLLQEAVEVQLRTKESEDFRSFWLENSLIRFTATKGSFKNAIISGSKTQVEADELESLVSVFRKQAWYNDSLFSKKVNLKIKKRLQKENDSLFKEELVTTKNFVKNNRNSIVSAYYLNFYASEFGKPLVTAQFNNFSNSIKNSLYGKDIAAYLKLNKDLKVGDHFADFSQQSPSGKTLKLSNYSDKIILLEFWASWCNPCRKDNPGLIKTYKQFKEKGFKVVGVAADDNKSNWLQAIKQDKLPWPQVCDLKGDKNDVVLMYGINKFPSNFLIDKKGIIIAQDLRGEELNEKLAELLK